MELGQSFGMEAIIISLRVTFAFLPYIEFRMGKWIAFCMIFPSRHLLLHST